MTPKEMSELHSQCMNGYQIWSEAYYKKLLESKTSIFKSSSFGFGCARLIKDEAEILMVLIKPTARRNGHATLILKKLAEELQSLGCKQIYLEVAATNKKAIALYLKNNFHCIGKRSKYYSLKNGNKIDALVLKINF